MARLIFKAPYYKPGHTTRKGQSRGGYAEYIAKREGVEILRSGMADYIGNRRGSNGLFSDEDVPINLSKIHEEIDNHPGNIWGFIISLRREDAERLGYSSAEQWINLLRSRRTDIAKEMGIAPANESREIQRHCITVSNGCSNGHIARKCASMTCAIPLRRWLWKTAWTSRHFRQ